MHEGALLRCQPLSVPGSLSVPRQCGAVQKAPASARVLRQTRCLHLGHTWKPKIPCNDMSHVPPVVYDDKPSQLKKS